MNKHLLLLPAVLLLAGAPSAFAAPSTDLTVTGLITPSACTPNLSNGGIAHHGEIPVKDLNPDKPTYLPHENLQMTVNCDAPTRFALEPIDNRSGTGMGNSYFGIGLVNGEKLGNFRVIPTNVIADAVRAQAIVSSDGGATWGKVGTDGFWGANNIWGVGELGADSAPIPVKELLIDLDVRTGIAATDGLTLTDEVTIDGSATLQIKYL
ncbi:MULTISPECIES: DUF1120 domain-containing protein [Pseudomonas]|uniref:Protein GltF n=1 Tax=Pseudomonas frederiksbergensis TaxID=104087 RepID=A0A2S8HTS8_9PSED|nr:MULTISPECIES: DUF1120 domain-containing protein [Pseudomonas]PQP05828.1 hypothetical protein C5612_04120 [Pseudomonas frederiksbergensis]WLG51882.1 DUF1120 domain-containing protein [Pseudomonas sp. FP1742]